MRARRSKSLTRRSIRSVWRVTIPEELPAFFCTERVILERLDIPTDGRQRSPQLVRNISHKVPANPVGSSQGRDVVQHEHRAAAGGVRRRSGMGREAPSSIRERDLEGIGTLASQRAGQFLDDARMANGLDVVVAGGHSARKQTPCNLVDELDASLPIHNQDAFGHFSQDRFHPGTMAAQIRQPAPLLLDRLIHGADDLPDIIVSVVVGPSRQVGRGIVAGNSNDAAQTSSHGLPHPPGNQSRPQPGQTRLPSHASV